MGTNLATHEKLEQVNPDLENPISWLIGATGAEEVEWVVC